MCSSREQSGEHPLRCLTINEFSHRINSQQKDGNRSHTRLVSLHSTKSSLSEAIAQLFGCFFILLFLVAHCFRFLLRYVEFARFAIAKRFLTFSPERGSTRLLRNSKRKAINLDSLYRVLDSRYVRKRDLCTHRAIHLINHSIYEL